MQRNEQNELPGAATPADTPAWESLASLRSTHCTLILGGALANRASRLASIRALI